MILNLDPTADMTDWAHVPASEQPGASGSTTVRTRKLGDLQIRLVSYSPHYTADHWCQKGHIVHVVSGALTISHQDQTTHKLAQGMSYHVADGGPAHMVTTSGTGATVFIVD